MRLGMGMTVPAIADLPGPSRPGFTPPSTGDTESMITEWTVTDTGTVDSRTIMWSEQSGAGSRDIDWGDGTSDSGVTGRTITHEYPVTGGTTVYEVKVKNSIGPEFGYYLNTYEDKLTAFKQWGSTTSLVNLNAAFYNCVNMTYTPTDSPAGQPSSLYQAFRNCESITTLNLSNFDLSQCTNLTFAFRENEDLVSVKLPTDLSSVTSCQYMLYLAGKSGSGCVFELDGLDWSSCTDFRYALADSKMAPGSSFANWTLKSGSWGTTNGMTGTFRGGAGIIDTLTHADFSGWTNSGNITNMYQTFWNREQWTSMDITGLEAGATATWAQTFRECKSVETITGLSSLDASSATTCERMFQQCYNLSFGAMSSSTNFGINWGPNFSNVNNIKYMFYEVGDTSLSPAPAATDRKGPDLSQWDTSGLNTDALSEALRGVKFLGDPTADANSKMDLANWYLNGGITTMSKFTWRNYGFATKINLTNAQITNSMTNMWQAFSTKNTATRDFDTIMLGSTSDFSNVTTMQEAFAYNNALTLQLPTNLDLTNLANGTNMAVGTTIDTAGYDRFLNRLKATWNTTAGNLNFGSSQYTKSILTTGTATSTTANKLVDASPGNDFGPGGLNVQIGDIVFDDTGNDYAKVTAVDNATTLSLNADIIIINDVYEIDQGTAAKDKEYLLDNGWTITDANGTTP